MQSQRVIKIAFLISAFGHLLLLGMPAVDIPAKTRKTAEPIELTVRQPRSELLPDIKTVADKKEITAVEETLLQKESPAQSKQERASEVSKEKVKAPDFKAEAMLRYRDAVKRKIQTSREYPAAAARKGTTGVTHVVFSLLSGGRVQAVEIVGSSGSAVLDRAAINTIKRAAPFEPIPAMFNRSRLTIEVALVFKLDEGG